MRLTHDQRLAMAQFLSERGVNAEGSHAALTLASLVDPADVTHSVVTNESGVLRTLLLTSKSLVYGELPADGITSFPGQGQTYEPTTLWVRPRSDIAAVAVTSVRLIGDREGVEVQPTFEIQFRNAPALAVHMSTWQSHVDAGALLEELLRKTL